MPVPAPIQLTLYDPETNEIKATYSRSFVPWKLLKQAVKLSKSLDADNMTDADIDALAGLVCEVFSNQFSVDALNDGADLSEMMVVITAIISRTRGAMPNPPPPGKS